MNSTQIQSIAPEDIEATFRSKTIDLISKPLGSRIIAFSDEWFAAAENLTTPTPPIRKIGHFTHAGAWYDGWETRRHNPEPFDWVIIRLGVASGRVSGVAIDTAFFDGNNAPEVAVEGCFSDNDEEVKSWAGGKGDWETILPVQEHGPSQIRAWKLPQLTEKAYTHVRLLMIPDGGIARFRLFGKAMPVFPPSKDTIIDLGAAQNGAVAVSCSDQHFGTKHNLLLPGRGVDMGDGWETKRSRGEHVDWVIVRLGAPMEITKLIIDTAHFRGNYPKFVEVEATNWTGEGDPSANGNTKWTKILDKQPCGPDVVHDFEGEVLRGVAGQTFTHAKLVIIPDGGVKRFRVLGRRA